MGLTKHTWIKIILISTLCLIICIGLGLATTRPQAYFAEHFRQNLPWNTATANNELSSMDMEAEKGQNLEISWVAGAVEITGIDDASRGNHISLREYYNGPVRPMPMDVRQNENTIVVDDKFSNLGAGCVANSSKLLRVEIPLTVAQNLGSITLNGASGSYLLENLDCQALAINLTSGQLKAAALGADATNLSLMSGKVSLEGDFRERLKADITSGNLSITSTGDSLTQADFTMTSGNATFCMPEDSGFVATLSKISGNFNCEFAAVQRGNRYDYEGHGKGNPCAINMTMTSGNFTLRPN